MMDVGTVNPKQQYYSGGGNHSNGNHVGHQHQAITSNQIQNPINLQNHSQSQNQTSQNGNTHIRSPSSSSAGNPINMSMSIPVTNAVTQHQNHQQMPQIPGSNALMLQQHGSSAYQVNNQHQNQNQLTGFTANGNGQLQQQQVQHNNNISTAMQQQQQQQHAIILNLGNLLDIDIDDRPHVCQVCQATYKTRTHLRRHMFIHLQNRPYPCLECSKGFNRKEHLNKHIEAVHSGTRYKCHLCGKDISRKDHLARHIKNMHNSDLNDPMVQAQMNPIPLSSSDSQLSGPSPQKKQQSQTPRANRLSQDATGENDEEGVHFMIADLSSSTCTTTSKLSCDKVPRTQAGFLPSTMTIIDQLKFNPSEFFVPTSPTATNKKMLNQLYTCRECHATFSLEKDLNIHSRVHKPQPYKCNQCPRAYTRREKLTEHIRCFHQGQKFSCEYCDKQLSRKDHVLRHVRSVHPEVLANRFVSITENGALDCVASGNNRAGGGSNTNSRSANDSSQSNNNTNIPSMGSMGDMGILLRSVCHVCLKVFGTSYHLQRHCESCHNGDNRPFACNFCKKQFKRKDHLTKHVKSHCPSMKDTTKSRGGASRKSSKVSSKRTIDPELSTIDQETIDSLQIEMTTPDEDVEVAIAIVNTSNAETKTVTTSASTSKDLLDTFISLSSNSIIPPSSISSGMSVTATNMNPKLPNSSSTYTRNLQEIISNTNNSKYKPSNVIARKSSAGSIASPKIEAKLATNMPMTMAVRTTADFTCGHCQAKFPTKDRMIQHLQSHPSTSSAPGSQQPVNTSQSISLLVTTTSSSNSQSHEANNGSTTTLQSVSAVDVLQLISNRNQ